MIQKSFFQTIVLISSILAAFPVYAEVSCTLTMSYEWQMTPLSSLNDDEKDTSAMKDKKRTEFVRRLQQSGASEAAVIRALRDKAFLLKRDVMRECAAIHENYSRCIASRYRSYSSDIRTGGFRVRKALEEAIQLDCKKLRGQCLQVVMSEPHCEDLSMKKEGDKKEKEKEKDKK